MKLSVIIINYNSPELVLDCLQSFMQTTALSYEIIIVDNASVDDSQQIIQTNYPEVKWIQMGYNAGFSRANNAGIKASRGEYVLLLNSDTIILNDALDKAVNCLEADVTSVAASVQLLNADQSPQNAGNFFIKGGLNILLTLPVINTWVKKTGNILKVKKPSIESSDTVNYVDWISGAFMLVKKQAIEKAGMMDEDFFLFSEEIEWCSRLKKTGRIAVFTDAKVIHLEGGTTKKIEKRTTASYFEYWTAKGGQLIISHLLRIRKQYGIGWLFVNYLIFITEVPILIIASLFMKQYSFKNVKFYCDHVITALTYLPRYVANKPYFYKVM